MLGRRCVPGVSDGGALESFALRSARVCSVSISDAGTSDVPLSASAIAAVIRFLIASRSSAKKRST
jgi:hypothetical protein